MILAKHLALVAAGGATGAMLRHLAGMASFKLMGPGFPFGTLFVNVVGSFAMGLFIEYLAHKFPGNQELRLLIATGLLGGFTTFSAFSLEFALLYERGALLSAGIYLTTSVCLAILALFFGLYAGRSVFAG